MTNNHWADVTPRAAGGHAGATAPPNADALQHVVAAFATGDVATARSLLREVVAATPPPPGAVLEELGGALINVGAVTDACPVFEQAFRMFLGEEQPHAAVRVAVRLVRYRDNLGEVAASQGWEQRALRLLAETGPCLEQGYLALARVGCTVHDPRELAERAALALAIARQFDDHELELRARGDQGLALIGQGKVAVGFALLDEVMVAVAAGEIANPETRAMTLCAMLTACERTGDVARADYWCRRIEEEPDLRVVPLLSAHCHVAYAAVEAALGHWESAETRLRTALQSPARATYHTTTALAQLAELCLAQGRVGEAAALLAGHEDEFEALPALAHLRLVEGKPAAAAALLETVARGLGDDRIRLAPVLALLVEADLASDQTAAATVAAHRLGELAETSESSEIQALARLAAGRLALHEGNTAAATVELETGLAQLVHADRPLLSGQLRLELARAHARAQETEAAVVVAEAARATFRKLRAVSLIAQADQVLAEIYAGPSAPPARARDPAGLTPREREVLGLIAAGKSNQEIAEQLVLSVRTVERHISTIYEKIGASGKAARAAATAYALGHGLG